MPRRSFKENVAEALKEALKEDKWITNQNETIKTKLC
jgi:hypothetical protein